MRTKLKYHVSKIQSPEDFIRVCATKSIFVGGHYTIICKDQPEEKTAVWLERELDKFKETMK